MKKLFSLVTVSMMTMTMLFTLPLRVSAASTDQALDLFDLKKSNSLTVVYHADQDDVDGTEIKLYQVAKWSEGYAYTLTEAFASTGIDPEHVESNDQWLTVADTLDSYIQANSPAAVAETKISGGKVDFNSLEAGLYFIPELTVVEENGIRTFSHVLLNLPEVVDSAWNYEVQTAPKSETYKPTYKDVNYFINVVWDDQGYEKYRPDSVVAHISHSGGPVGDETIVVKSPSKSMTYGMSGLSSLVTLFTGVVVTPSDAEVPSDVTISSNMNWHYEWTAKDDGTVWNVSGSEVEHYTLTVKTVDHGWILEYHIVPPPSPVPKTGEAFPWLPVVLLFVSGTTLVVFGLVSRRKAHD